MDVKARLARNLKHHRRAAGVSQEEFADRCGLHRTYVSGVERGVRNPTITVLARIAAALGLPPGRLLDDDPEAGQGAD